MREEIRSMTMDEVKDRLQEIIDEIDADAEGLDVQALDEEVDELNERKAELDKMAETRTNLEKKVSASQIVVRKFEEEKVEEEKMDNKEIRSTQEYAQAYANFIKSGKDTECRSLLTENVSSGSVPVPTMLADKIQHAWDSNEIMNLVTKTNIRGNVKVGFEMSATGAEIHIEGTNAPAEETLELGVVEIIPQTIKKWITISDEVVDLDGVSFLDYIYDEIAYQIVKKASEILLGKIVALPNVSTSNAVGSAMIMGNPAFGVIAEAIANLSDEATNPIIVMNKLTYADFKKAQYEGNFNADIFEGLKVVFSNVLPAYSTADDGDIIGVVGDFKGAQVNLPNGEITFKYDDLSLAEQDLVKIVGRESVGMGIVKPYAFTRLVKAPSAK